ncbi:MAG: cupin domain-containing protein [Candidatus Binataceae bacterium]
MDNQQKSEVDSVPKQIRRIVTGVNAAGRSAIIIDGPAPDVIPFAGSPLAFSTLLWTTDRAPASNGGNADMAPAGRMVPVAPAHSGGTVFRIVEFAPDKTYDISKVNMAAHGAEVTADRTAKHYRFHRTNTVDYGIVLEGEIWAIFDEGEALLNPGDVVIQRGTYHSWANRSDQVCRMAFILIDADPPS